MGTNIVTQPYGGGERWYCPNCDVRQGIGRMKVVSWTNGKAPTVCLRCSITSKMLKTACNSFVRKWVE